MASLLQSASLLYRRNVKSHASTAAAAGCHGLLSAELFSQTLYLERKRTERSGRGFVLMTLASKLLDVRCEGQALARVLDILARSTRDTDIKGWRKQGAKIGVIFTEIGVGAEAEAAIKALRRKVAGALENSLDGEQVGQITLTFWAYPENWEQAGGSNPESYDGLFQDNAADPLPRVLKRALDITGSLAALILGLPLFVTIAAAVKLTSEGPVLFRQKRMGQYGRKFDFLKFRSMYVNNDESIHREFVKTFISSGNGCQMQFKLTADPRITRVGRFLRQTSLDELPQFLNVLKGEMSLVGPRPPIPYELESYGIWHRTRLLAAKPGITGLWQVSGRSRVKFDDMVRMDLRYAKSWSLWLDLKILLQTPHAVLSGNGAR